MLLHIGISAVNEDKKQKSGKLWTPFIFVCHFVSFSELAKKLIATQVLEICRMKTVAGV